MSTRAVSCGTHGELQTGYVCCKCVATGQAPVNHYIAPKGFDELGEITCGRFDHAADDIVLICSTCALEKGIDRIGGQAPRIQ